MISFALSAVAAARALFLFLENYAIVASPHMIGSGSPLPVQAIHLFHAAPRDVVVLRAKLLSCQRRFVATGAEPFSKIRLHPLRVILLLISAARLDHAIQTEPSSLERCLSTLYAQP